MCGVGVTSCPFVGSLRVVAVVNNAAMGVEVRISSQISDLVFFGGIPEVELLGHMAHLFLIF